MKLWNHTSCTVGHREAQLLHEGKRLGCCSGGGLCCGGNAAGGGAAVGGGDAGLLSGGGRGGRGRGQHWNEAVQLGRRQIRHLQAHTHHWLLLRAGIKEICHSKIDKNNNPHLSPNIYWHLFWYWYCALYRIRPILVQIFRMLEEEEFWMEILKWIVRNSGWEGMVRNGWFEWKVGHRLFSWIVRRGQFWLDGMEFMVR